MPNFGKKLL
jgi:hypothetical protein